MRNLFKRELSSDEKLRLEKSIELMNRIRSLKNSEHWETIIQIITIMDKELDTKNLNNIRDGKIYPEDISQNTMARVAIQDFIFNIDSLEQHGEQCQKTLLEYRPKPKGGNTNA